MIRAVKGFLLWPIWDEIWTENENIGPHKPDSCITHALSRSYRCGISQFEVPAVKFDCRSLLYQTQFVRMRLCLLIPECYGCVHYCMSECVPMINKGLLFPPSLLCIQLFLVCVVSDRV